MTFVKLTAAGGAVGWGATGAGPAALIRERVAPASWARASSPPSATPPPCARPSPPPAAGAVSPGGR